jgi:hypothetical protein
MSEKPRPPAESPVEDAFRAAAALFIQQHRELRVQLVESRERIDELRKALNEAMERLRLPNSGQE